MKKLMILNILILLGICLISESYLSTLPVVTKMLCAFIGGGCIGIYNLKIMEFIKKGE